MLLTNAVSVYTRKKRTCVLQTVKDNVCVNTSILETPYIYIFLHLLDFLSKNRSRENLADLVMSAEVIDSALKLTVGAGDRSEKKILQTVKAGKIAIGIAENGLRCIFCGGVCVSECDS